MAEQTIICTGDTFISRYSGSDNNYGSAELAMWREISASAFMGIFVQFNFPAFDNKEIVSAVIRLHNKIKVKNSIIGCAQYNIPDISNLTGNLFYSKYLDSDIAWSPTEYETKATVEDNNEWIEWDVTSIVKNNVGKNNVVLAVYSIDDKVVPNLSWKYTSKEGGRTPYINVVYNNAVPSLPTILYPNGDVIEKSGSITFQWKYNSLYDTGQAKFEFGWRKQGEAEWTTISQNTSDQSYTMETAAISIGIVEWRVQTYNAINAASGYAYGTFELTGRPASPIITGMKNEAITEITWKCNESENAVYTLQIIKDGKTIHDSGERAGGLSDSYVPDMMLENGQYVVKMRIGSVYGIWSDESAQVFSITAPVPPKPSIRVSALDAGVKITTDSAAGTKYVYRSEEGGVYSPIGRFAGNEYEDYTVKSGRLYRYIIRAYAGGYTDSTEADIIVKYKGVRLAEVSNLAESIRIIKSTSDWHIEIQQKKSNESELVSYEGRTYKVKESGIHKESTISTSFYLPNKEAELLERIHGLNGIYLFRNSETCICCEITDFSFKNDLFDRGKTFDLSLSRINYDLGVRFGD